MVQIFLLITNFGDFSAGSKGGAIDCGLKPPTQTMARAKAIVLFSPLFDMAQTMI